MSGGAPRRAPPRSGQRARTPSAWRARLLRLLHLVAEQALPLTIAGVSFVIALDAWLSARPVLWEHQRALASLSIGSELDAEDTTGIDTRHTITISNVGELSFAVLDVQVGLALAEGMQAPWLQNTLLQETPGALPIGLRPFHLEAARDGRSARFAFGAEASGWHIIDPGRSVELVFAQPVQGYGRLGITVEVFTQPLRMGAMADQITVERIIAGRRRQVFPESGPDEVSDLGVFPYSAASVVTLSDAAATRAAPTVGTPAARRARRWNDAANP
ncbi:hypothetical protein ACLB90_09515 [Stenotrophomonas sp. LGBM10]|uniref:hypothetical protein n=1 Tax=Stenotrophomonas sp. LGBM10 TaxID=3390038 RepID=UPI00398ADBA1